jgi:hypothetical protein
MGGQNRRISFSVRSAVDETPPSENNLAGVPLDISAEEPDPIADQGKIEDLIIVDMGLCDGEKLRGDQAGGGPSAV